MRMAHRHDLLRPRIEGRAENGCPHIGGLCITAVVCKRAVPDVRPSEVLRAFSNSVPHKDFSDLCEKMSGKGESASEAHLPLPRLHRRVASSPQLAHDKTPFRSQSSAPPGNCNESRSALAAADCAYHLRRLAQPVGLLQASQTAAWTEFQPVQRPVGPQGSRG